MIAIRNARIQDANSVPELMLSSGAELYHFIYSTKQYKALDYIRYEFKSGRGFCGYQNTTVLVSNEQVIGVGCFYDRKVYWRLLLETIVNMLMFYGVIQVWRVFLRSDYVVRHIIKKPKQRELYLMNFAIHPFFQRQGFAGQFLGAKIQEAEERGYQLFGLDVAADNLPAERLYVRHGLQCVAVKSFNWFNKGIAIAASKKMELVLVSPSP